ncbi:MAG TPA: N-acyl homoserine lactonase family protein [Aquabacterium sp.]|nr:N-acyl homoserine lactonase family protein [Aquabacterium sp.]
MRSKLFKALTAAALCAASMTASAQIKLWQVTSGFLELDKGFLTAMSGVGTKVNAPVTMHIIQHPKGVIVFDTGVNVAVAEGGCASYWGAGLCSAFNHRQSRDEVIDRQLQKLGFKVDDVKYVIYSHFHLDHAGNIKLFPKARHVVQNAELKNAWWPEKFQRAAFVLKDFDTTRDFDFLELNGDFDLFGDGTVTVLDTKGHTQGHQSLMLKLPKSGYVIMSGDAVYTNENEKGVVPGITWSADYSMKAIDRLKMLRDTRGGQLWYSHEPAQYEANKGKVFE